MHTFRNWWVSVKVLNILRCLVWRDWEANSESLGAIYTGLVRSMLDCGCVACNSVADTTLGKSDVIWYQVLRLCTGAFKTTPTVALQMEMREMPLGLRREHLRLNYWANLQGQDHPTLEVFKPCWEKGGN